MNNIILIGMPGSGKSTIGVVLAKVIGYQFIDSDLLIQKEAGRRLAEIIEQQGVDGFIRLEEQVNRRLVAERSVIATGGSAVYGQAAMEHLRQIGTVVYLKLSYQSLKKRLGNLKGRGVVLKKGQDLRQLYDERVPLYEKYADLVIDGENLGVEETLELLVNQLEKLRICT